ncbi:MAG: FHA domain-containing protein [Planctomycetaceae bacterium]|nr:FHA domain-containing protein [Planctomycetaceae bacterium]
MFALKLVEVPEGTATALVGKILKLKTLPATIGRGKDATIVVQHRKLSRLHCRFYLSDEKLHVRDLGSTNGTTVNGTPVNGAVLLRVGDCVSAGGVVFQIGRFVASDLLNSASTETPEDPTAAGLVVPTESSVAPKRPVVAVEVSPESIGTETVDWKSNASSELLAAGNRLEIEPADPKEGTSQLAPVTASGIAWPNVARSVTDSAIHIDIFDAKGDVVAAEELPDFNEVPRVEIDPKEIDLSDVAETKKDASVTALGNFFSQQNLRRK